MSRRVLPVALILAGAVADTAGMHAAAFYLLLAAVPLTAVAALASFAWMLDRPTETATLQALLWGLGLAFVVVGCAARGPSLATGGLPQLGRSALGATLVVLAVKGCVWAWTAVRPRLGRGPAPRASRA